MGLAAPAESDGEAEATLVKDHVQEFQPPPIGGGVELEVQRPYLIQMLGLVSPHRAVGGVVPAAAWEGQGAAAPLPTRDGGPACGSRTSPQVLAAVGEAPGKSHELIGDSAEATQHLDSLKAYVSAVVALSAAMMSRNMAGKDSGLRSFSQPEL